jgi:hypothetical protein
MFGMCSNRAACAHLLYLSHVGRLRNPLLCVVHALSSVATEEVSLYTQTWNEFADTARKKRAVERGEAVSPSHIRA